MCRERAGGASHPQLASLQVSHRDRDTRAASMSDRECRSRIFRDCGEGSNRMAWMCWKNRFFFGAARDESRAGGDELLKCSR